jgi:hypothetical protein
LLHIVPWGGLLGNCLYQLSLSLHCFSWAWIGWILRYGFHGVCVCRGLAACVCEVFQHGLLIVSCRSRDRMGVVALLQSLLRGLGLLARWLFWRAGCTWGLC